MIIKEVHRCTKKYIQGKEVGDLIFRAVIVHKMENLYCYNKHSSIRSAVDRILRKMCDKKIIKHTEQKGVYSILKIS